ncbi:MAG TPA: SpoIIE family protein phosphatase [Gemmatimonadales bacterium]|jgi:serine/threonine protein phosphatase PrpC|nr:SpoIIE family protein phosphatase [Gemmatimonadales bacterium]
MASAQRDATAHLHWGVATLALAGQAESGDLHLVAPVPRGVLVAVVDGLGHGEEAAAAAKLAVRTLERFADDEPLALLQRCHLALKGTRGVVMSLARFDVPRGSVTWLGVGNVEGIVHHANWAERSARVSLVTRGGIVGSELPAIQPAVIPVEAGDTLIFATDGIRGGFTEDISDRVQPQRLANQILSRYGKGTDDALVLVATYLGRK